MSAKPDGGQDEGGIEAERQASSMQDQLSKEVASWSKVRRQQSSEAVIAPSPPIVQRRSPRPAATPKRSRASLAGDPVTPRSRSFSMSYDGMTQAEYIQYLLDRGSS